jgi:hypothetical protein
MCTGVYYTNNNGNSDDIFIPVLDQKPSRASIWGSGFMLP